LNRFAQDVQPKTLQPRKAPLVHDIPTSPKPLLDAARMNFMMMDAQIPCGMASALLKPARQSRRSALARLIKRKQNRTKTHAHGEI
jgi:hypothetical protein